MCVGIQENRNTRRPNRCDPSSSACARNKQIRARARCLLTARRASLCDVGGHPPPKTHTPKTHTRKSYKSKHHTCFVAAARTPREQSGQSSINLINIYDRISIGGYPLNFYILVCTHQNDGFQGRLDGYYMPCHISWWRIIIIIRFRLAWVARCSSGRSRPQRGHASASSKYIQLCATVSLTFR